jgi:diaminopimelate decarboxylase
LSGAPTPQIVEPGTAALLAEAAERFATPCYVTDLRVLDRRAGELGAEFPDPWIRQYSLKANPLPAVVARLAESGFGANVVSSGEWAAATAAGLGNDLITLEGIGKTDDDLEAAVAAATRGRPLRWVTLESPEEADRLSGMTKAAGLDQAPNGLDVLLRLNPEVVPETSIDLCVGAKSSKFGMTRAEIGEWVESNRRSPSGLVIRGIHVHVGSQLRAVGAWTQGAIQACRLQRELSQVSTEIDTVDFGGGFPSGEVSSPPPSTFRKALDDSMAQAGLSLPARSAVEPGRYLVADAGWIVSRVLHVRRRDGVQQAVIDASFAELIRPALYGARHDILAILTGQGPAGEECESTLVEGSVCESTDTFGIHQLPRLSRGDVVAIAGTGAYSSSMFSSYNGRPRPPEVAINVDLTLSLARAASPYLP